MPKRTIKSVRTPEVRERLLNAIKAGNYIETACEYAGVSKTAFYRWLKADRDFEHAIKEAVAQSEASLVAQIRQDTSWQSKAWILERRWPERWGKRDRVDTDNTIRVVYDDPPPDAAPWAVDRLPDGVEVYGPRVRETMGENVAIDETGDSESV